MDTSQAQILLYKWSDIIIKGKLISKEKAQRTINGLAGRIKRTTGQPIVFDIETHNQQQIIQNSLCLELPQWADLIRSQPAIMDGYSWTRNDFIDLYFEYFSLIIEKLRRIIGEIEDDQ